MLLIGFLGGIVIESLRWVDRKEFAKRQTPSPTVTNARQLQPPAPPTLLGGTTDPLEGKPIPALPSKPTPQLEPKSLGVALRFVYPPSPALVIVNQSDTVARDIKWTVLLWNMDLPDHNDPLPIPVGTFDFIRPHREGGPQNLFGSPYVSPLIKPGDRLFGSAAVDCPDCARGRTYVVYIVFGKNGWFSEALKEESGGAFRPKSFDKAGRDEYFRVLDAGVPEEYRISIPEN